MGGTAGFYRTGARQIFSSLSSYVAGFSLVYLFWALFSGSEAYTNFGYGFSLLAAFGAAGCLGHLVVYAYRGSERLFCVWSVLSGVELGEVRQPGSILSGRADWPLLVALLFGPFFVLLAGLGGWV